MTPDTSLRDILERHPEPARPRVIGIAATHPRALRMCACSSPESCCGSDGRSPAGNRCKAHLVDQLAEAT